MANEENLRPWKPGQSGNPAGCSRKVRKRVLLRDFIHDQLPKDISPEDRIELQVTVEGLTQGQLIAAGILRRAMRGDVKAIDQILGTEPKLVELSGELDLLGDPEQADLADSLAALSQRRRTNGSGRGPHPSAEEDAGP